MCGCVCVCVGGGGGGGGAGGYFMLLFSMLFVLNPELKIAKQTKFWKNIFIDNIFDANIFI